MQQTKPTQVCPDCGDAVEVAGVDRRGFLRSVAVAAAGLTTTSGSLFAMPRADDASSYANQKPESLVKVLFESLNDQQKKVVCFDWDYKDKERGLLRTRVANNWHITKPAILSDFYTKDQQTLCREVFKGLFNPDWVPRIDKQLKDDTDGKPWGSDQNIAIFGKPGSDKFELVMTGRHMTMRCDGNSAEHVAFGGPIFHGHAASGANEKPHHPGNVFWHQGVLANQVYKILDGKQQEKALVARRPAEQAAGFRGAEGKFPGLAVTDMSRDQKLAVEEVLMSLLAPYRKADQDEVKACLRKQGGLDKCALAFYKDGDIGDDGEWDNWRLEGPSFVWYFRGHPHVHIWINVADDSSVALNA